MFLDGSPTYATTTGAVVSGTSIGQVKRKHSELQTVGQTVSTLSSNSSSSGTFSRGPSPEFGLELTETSSSNLVIPESPEYNSTGLTSGSSITFFSLDGSGNKNKKKKRSKKKRDICKKYPCH